PSLVLERGYLDAIRALPLSHQAVRLDGPKPGISDARWSPAQLEQLARALPDHELVLTAWGAPQQQAIDELAARLPSLILAGMPNAIEIEADPVGELALACVERNRDDGGDKGALDDAADALAEVVV